MFAPRRHTRKQQRRGTLTIELLLALPVFMALVVGMVGMADLLITEQMLSEASGRAARAAALGGTEEQVQDAVRSVLGPERAERATIHVGRADGSLEPVAPGALIEVRVEIEAQFATATRLAPIRSDEILIGRTVMQRE